MAATATWPQLGLLFLSCFVHTGEFAEIKVRELDVKCVSSGWIELSLVNIYFTPVGIELCPEMSTELCNGLVPSRAPDKSEPELPFLNCEVPSVYWRAKRVIC
jgi:hypothetical protein